MERWNLYLGDGLEMMREMASGVADAVITDPPYGTTNAPWDRAGALTPAWWREAERVTRPNGAIVVFACGQFTPEVLASAPVPFRYKWVWVRGERPTGHLDVKVRPLRIHEDILIFGREMPEYRPVKLPGLVIKQRRKPPGASSKLYGAARGVPSETVRDYRVSVDVIVESPPAPGTAERVHLTQKPERLMRLLADSYSREGGLVVDPFAGSGTTGVGCMQAGRRFAGSELDPEIHALAEMRLIGASSTLFDSEPPAKPGRGLFSQGDTHERAE